jgi:hypothetical protein
MGDLAGRDRARPDAGQSQLNAVFLPIGGLLSLTVFADSSDHVQA